MDLSEFYLGILHTLRTKRRGLFDLWSYRHTSYEHWIFTAVRSESTLLSYWLLNVKNVKARVCCFFNAYLSVWVLTLTIRNSVQKKDILWNPASRCGYKLYYVQVSKRYRPKPNELFKNGGLHETYIISAFPWNSKNNTHVI